MALDATGRQGRYYKVGVSMTNTNEQLLLLDDFKTYLQQEEQTAESIFDLGWSMPNSKGLGEEMSDYISWTEVEKFLLMAQESLRVRERRAEELEERLLEKHRQLEQEQQEKSQERLKLKDKVQQLERENAFLSEENQLLRRQVEADVGGEEGGGSGGLARLHEELRGEQQRVLVWENEAIQLRARVAALERANQAQHMAMLSCIEESERVRLQQERSASDCLPLQRLHICGSPVTHADWALQLTSGSTFTDESADYDAASHASCVTPRQDSIGKGGARSGLLHGREAGFRAASEPLPSPSVLLPPKPPISVHGRQQR
ncbi:hypothetical protein N2152v2_009107 [Parachlorella kessleri]